MHKQVTSVTSALRMITVKDLEVPDARLGLIHMTELARLRTVLDKRDQVARADEIGH